MMVHGYVVEPGLASAETEANRGSHQAHRERQSRAKPYAVIVDTVNNKMIISTYAIRYMLVT